MSARSRTLLSRDHTYLPGYVLKETLSLLCRCPVLAQCCSAKNHPAKPSMPSGLCKVAMIALPDANVIHSTPVLSSWPIPDFAIIILLFLCHGRDCMMAATAATATPATPALEPITVQAKVASTMQA